jgi:hypothetical protein
MPTLVPLTSPRDKATFQRCLAFARKEHARGGTFKEGWDNALPGHYCPKTEWPEFDPWCGDDGEEFTVIVPSDSPQKYRLVCKFEGFDLSHWLFAVDLDEFDLLEALARNGRSVSDWNELADERDGSDFIQVILECLRRGYLTLRDLELYGGPVLPDGFECSDSIKLRIESYDVTALRVCEKRQFLVSDDVIELFKSYRCQSVPVCWRFRGASRFAYVFVGHGGYRFEFLDGEEVRSADITDAELRSEGSGLWKRLARDGFIVESTKQAQDAFRTLLRDWPILDQKPSLLKFSRSGFHCDNLVYVSPNGDAVIDQAYEGSRLFDLAAEAKISGGTGRTIAVECRTHPIDESRSAAGGDLEAPGYQGSARRNSPSATLSEALADLAPFKAEVLDPVFGNPDFQAIAYSILQTCSGIVTGLAESEGLGILWWAHARDGAPSSSTGKSTAQRIGASIAGSHEENQGLFLKADLSRDHLKNKLFQLTGGALHLDESATAKLGVEALAYTAGGSATSTPFSLSSEKRIDELASDVRAGASVRLATLDLSKIRPKAVNRLTVDRIKRDALRHGRHGDVLLRVAAEAMAQGWHRAPSGVALAIEERAVELLSVVGIDPDQADGAARLRTATAFAAASLAGDLLAAAGLIEAAAADAAVSWAWRNHIEYLREFGAGADAPADVDDPDVAAFVKWLRTSSEIIELGELDGPGGVGWRKDGAYWIKMKPLDAKRLRGMGVHCDRSPLLKKLEKAKIFRPNPRRGSGHSAGYERVPQTGRHKSIWHYRFVTEPLM